MGQLNKKALQQAKAHLNEINTHSVGYTVADAFKHKPGANKFATLVTHIKNLELEDEDLEEVLGIIDKYGRELSNAVSEKASEDIREPLNKAMGWIEALISEEDEDA